MDESRRPGTAAQSSLEEASTVLGRPQSVEHGPEREPHESSEALGHIGPFTILEEIGTGGMGRVFLAEQQEPIRRRVAIKVMKTSLTGAEAVARFSAERQAMARLGHPNVARIFDGGTTEDGKPFFVMEHVPGESITEYCDRESLAVDERLRLFREACAGVQHAHLNQILHRDLKPFNILVTEVDGEPVVKIIDFGIAKALDRPLVDEALESGARLIGTPSYMSPEALREEKGGEHRIDARTDVYSLGVVLYELLAGARPFSGESGLADMVRQVCEVRAARPSRRVSAMSEAVASGVAERRRVKPVELARRLSGDLDAIVQKAIAKDPEDRYPSAAELAAEIDRHLAHEPVLAGPRTLRYRFGKLVRRHRVASAAAAVALAALVVGIAGTTYGLIRARHEAELARSARAEEERARRDAEKVGQFLVNLFEVADPYEEARGREVTARELLDQGAERIGRELEEQPRIRARMMVTLGKIYNKLGLHEQALPLLEESLRLRRSELGERHPEVAESLIELGVAYRGEGRLDEAVAVSQEALDLQETLLGDRAPQLVDTLRRLAAVHTTRGDFARSQGLLLRALDLAERTAGPDSEEVADVSSALGACYAYQGLFSKAEPLFRRALAIHEKKLGGDHPRVATNLNSLALIASNGDRFPEAEELFRRSLAIYEKVLGEEHPRIRVVLSNLGYTLFQSGRYEDALVPLERAAALDEAVGAPDTSALASRLTNLGLVYWKLGRLAEAEPLFLRATAIRERLLAPGHPHRATSIWGLANVYRDQGRFTEAEALYRKALEIREAALPPGHRELNQALQEYAVLLRATGREEEAADLESRIVAAQ